MFIEPAFEFVEFYRIGFHGAYKYKGLCYDSNMSQSWLKDLNNGQKTAVMSDHGPMLILAGAGSGKTRALTYKAAYLVKEKGVDPSNILLVTFTNKAAKEMKERVEKLIGEEIKLGFIGTFHALGARILRIEGKKIGVERDYLIYDEADSLEIIKQAIKNLNLESATVKPRAVKATISGAKNELLGALEYLQMARGEWQEKVGRIYLEYQRLLETYGALDFDDLLMKTVRLFKKEPQVLDKYSNNFEHVLVDEYQDTNKAQYELTRMLSKRWRNLCAVGDFSQSIYSFRGADFRNLNNLKKDYPNLKVINLEQNYRSTANILKAANKVISKNTMHPILRLWTEEKGGEKLKIIGAENEKQEAEIIIDLIKQSGENLREIVILYRTNAQSRIIEEALIKAGISYVLVGGVRFYGRKEVKDCLAYLKFLVNPKDKISYTRLEKLGKRRLNKFLEWKKENKEEIKKMETKKILEEILEASEYLDRFNPKEEEDLMRLENIEELKSVGEEFKNIGEFLEQVALVEQTDLLEEKKLKDGKKDAVTLMTLHASKGLEFKIVFMIGMEEGLFPHSRSMINKQELEEERRLCYVGITRAKERVFLSYAYKRLYFGTLSNNAVSRFLREIDEELVETVMGEFNGQEIKDNDIIITDDY